MTTPTDATVRPPRGKQTVVIVTDSASDLADEVVARLGIRIVALSIRFGTEEFVDRVDLTAKQFWSKVAASAELPQTAAPSPGAFEEAFRAAAGEGYSAVICITLSSKLSATHDSAILAAQSVRDVIDVRVVDSLSITMGQGAMVIVAAEAALAGEGVNDVEASARALLGRIRVLGALDTLENLKKGGRIGGAQALLGSLLAVKPILNLSSGVVEQAGKQRTRAKALAHLVDLARTDASRHGGVEWVSAMHGDATDIDAFVAQLHDLAPAGVTVGQIGAVIGTHGGRGVMGLTYVVRQR